MTETLPASVSYRTLIVEDDTLVGLSLKAQLERLGHVVVGHAHTCAKAEELYRQSLPELLLLDIRLGAEDGIALARQLLQIHPAACVIVSAFGDAELIAGAGEAGAFGYLIKPVSNESLAAQVGIAVRRFNDQQKLQQEKKQLIESLESRKLVERAKGIFMRRFKLDEPEAHRKLQLESQNRRISLAELARKVIESEELMGK